MSLWNIDTLQTLARLACSTESGMDMVLLLENAGSPVAGESPRPYADGKPRLDVMGWAWGHAVHAHGAADGSRSYAPLAVVRRIDAATGSIASLLNKRSLDLTATLAVYRAGGDSQAALMQPMFEIKLEQGQLIGQYVLTDSATATPLEILAFSYRKLAIRTAPQQASGLRGAVRECQITAANVG